MAALQEGIISVGRDVTTGNAAVWTSPDGVTWTRVAHEDALFGDGKMLTATADGTRAVVIGGTGDELADCNPCDAWVWDPDE